MSQETKISDTYGMFKQMSSGRRKLYSDPKFDLTDNIARRSYQDLLHGRVELNLTPALQASFDRKEKLPGAIKTIVTKKLDGYFDTIHLLRDPIKLEELRNLIINAKKKVAAEVLDTKGDLIPYNFTQSYLEAAFFGFKTEFVSKSFLEYIFDVKSTQDEFKLISGYYNLCYMLKVCDTGGDFRPQHATPEYITANPVYAKEVHSYTMLQGTITGDMAILFCDPNIGVHKSEILPELIKQANANSVHELFHDFIEFVE